MKKLLILCIFAVSAAWADDAIRNEFKAPADATVNIENIKVVQKEGYRRWDFDWVFREHDGIGVTLTDYEMHLTSPLPGASKVNKGTTYIRVEPRGKYRESGFMWLDAPTENYSDDALKLQMHTVYRGKDDNGNPVTVEGYFFQ
jgi:hypothetical protein